MSDGRPNTYHVVDENGTTTKIKAYEMSLYSGDVVFSEINEKGDTKLIGFFRAPEQVLKVESKSS